MEKREKYLNAGILFFTEKMQTQIGIYLILLSSQAVASPAYIVASLENLNEVSADFFCPVKKCFEFACEANFRKSMIPEYMREYEEIEIR